MFYNICFIYRTLTLILRECYTSTATTTASGLLTSVGVTAALPSNSSALSILATRRIISSKMGQFTSSTHRVPARSIGPLFIC